MKIKYKLGIWVITVMSVALTVISIFLLQQTSNLSYYLSIRSLEHLTNHRAEFWKSREDGYIRTLHTLANIMGNYESIEAAQRRDRYDDMLRSSLEAEPQMGALYTVWKPNAIDNMDSYYIGRTGSSQTGQYAMAYSRETGKVAGRASYDIRNVMSHISGVNARKDCVNNPSILKINGTDTFIIRMVVPIINHRTNEVVGGLGCFFVIDTIQHIMENTMKTNGEITMMAMYSSNGTILAHFRPERVGKHMLDVDEELGDSRQAMYQAIQKGNLYKDTKYSPVFNENIIYVMQPFQIGNSDQNWSMLIGVSESSVLKEVNSIRRSTIMLTVITVLLILAIIFTILKTIPKKQQPPHSGRHGDGRKVPTQSANYVNESTLSSKNDTEEMFNGSSEVTNKNRKLDQVTNEDTVRIDDMEAASEQLNTTAAKIREICLKNKESINFLARESNWLKLTNPAIDSKKKHA